MYVFDFDTGDGTDKDLLGGKGAGLATMTQIGLPVPPGFTLSTEACRRYLHDGEFSDELWEEVRAAGRLLEEKTGRSFGGSPPLLLSVRSGAKFSMPGMMDTVLNLGMNDAVWESLRDWSGDPHFAWDAYRRFVQTFGKVVLGIEGVEFERVLTELRGSRRVDNDAELTVEDLEAATRRFQQVVADHGTEIPEAPLDQLRRAVTAVFASWDNRRAKEYRRLNDIPDDLGTACNVQMMVFGDLDDASGTGVCFTRDPSTGEAVPYGDYLPNAQGEDVVAGIRRTLTLDDLATRHPGHHASLAGVMKTLEGHYRDMCDIEFTIERERLWILQTRVGKRTAPAAVRIAVEMVSEGLIGRETAVRRIDPAALEQILHPRIDEEHAGDPIAVGLAASPGAACGVAVFDADTAVERSAAGDPVILVRWETNPDDIHGLAAAEGVLTSHGGKTSHAAVVARGMGKPAVTGTDRMHVEEDERRFTIGDLVIAEGDVITIDGGSGKVFVGECPVTEPDPSPELEVLLGWADDIRRLGVWANADTGPDATHARSLGAEGVGLARTEHMFMGDRLPIVRRIILEADDADTAIEELSKLQTEDFESLLESMDGLPVVIRLLDPPLHEFLPDRLDLAIERERAAARGDDTTDMDEMLRAVARWSESNPMLGLRGVRLGFVRPELYRAQVQAAVEAVRRRVAAGGDPHLEIMIPLVATGHEMDKMAATVREIVDAADPGANIKVGTMIEIPRAALRAGDIARSAEFFSFGTNDLTQMTYGFSRDDAEGKFLPAYVSEGILAESPFEKLDVLGVGRLVEVAVKEGKETRPDLVAGICGEHGGDPRSIAFFHRVGLDYVSCSPPRVPIARLAAAQASLGEVDRSTV